MVQTLTYTSNSNRLATHDGLSVTLDSAGSTTADATQNVSFTYGDHNRMDTASVGGVLQATYTYNAHGQRVKKVEATGSSRKFIYHYGLNGELIGESVYNSGGTLIEERDYIWLDTLPVAQAEQTFSGGTLSGSALVYLHADQLNTPRLATDVSGTVVWRWDSDVFGIGAADLDPDSDTNEINVRLKFPGQYYDDETGLHYNYFRDYYPVTGRYTQYDPIGLEGGLNPYLYAEGNPLAFIDPLGLESRSEVRRAWNRTHGPRTPGAGMGAGPFGYWREFLGAGSDFVDNYSDMRQADWIGADKYFHCKANCEGAQRGPGGEDMSCLVSDTREWWDLNIKGYPAADSAADQAANVFGRSQGSMNPAGPVPAAACSALCSAYRPSGLPARY